MFEEPWFHRAMALFVIEYDVNVCPAFLTIDNSTLDIKKISDEKFGGYEFIAYHSIKGHFTHCQSKVPLCCLFFDEIEIFNDFCASYTKDEHRSCRIQD